jgi:COX assembly protein 1
MNSCMAVHATAEEQDRAREEWFVTMEERRKKREEKELKRREQEQFHREWWGLDEQGRRIEKDPKKSVFGLSDGEKNAKR